VRHNRTPLNSASMWELSLNIGCL